MAKLRTFLAKSIARRLSLISGSGLTSSGTSLGHVTSQDLQLPLTHDGVQLLTEPSGQLLLILWQ